MTNFHAMVYSAKWGFLPRVHVQFCRKCVRNHTSRYKTTYHEKFHASKREKNTAVKMSGQKRANHVFSSILVWFVEVSK